MSWNLNKAQSTKDWSWNWNKHLLGLKNGSHHLVCKTLFVLSFIPEPSRDFKHISHDCPKENLSVWSCTFWLSVNCSSEPPDPPKPLSLPIPLQTTAPVQGIGFGLIPHRPKGKPEQLRQHYQDCKSIIKTFPVLQSLLMPLLGPCFPLECVWSSQDHKDPHAKCFLPHVAPPVIFFLLPQECSCWWIKQLQCGWRGDCSDTTMQCWSSSEITRGLPDLPCFT